MYTTLKVLHICSASGLLFSSIVVLSALQYRPTTAGILAWQKTLLRIGQIGTAITAAIQPITGFALIALKPTLFSPAWCAKALASFGLVLLLLLPAYYIQNQIQRLHANIHDTPSPRYARLQIASRITIIALLLAFLLTSYLMTEPTFTQATYLYPSHFKMLGT